MTHAYTHSLHFFKVPELRELCKLCHDKDSDVNITTRKACNGFFNDCF